MAGLASMKVNSRKRLVLALPPPPTPSAKTLVKALIGLSKVVSNCLKPKVCQKRNAYNIVRRIEVLTPFLEEIRESQRPIPPSAVLAFRDLHGWIQRVSMLLEECKVSSVFWLLMEQETYTQYFHELTESLGSTLKSIPFELLDLSDEVREHTDLVQMQVLRTRLDLNPTELRLRKEVIDLLEQLERKEAPVLSQLQALFNSVQLLNARDCQTEIRRLEEISVEVGRKEDINTRTKQGLASLISFLRYGKYVLYSADFENQEDDVSEVCVRNESEDSDKFSSSRGYRNDQAVSPPVEFLCPVTLDLMSDPVTVATGQTYDRTSITKWMQEGHSTCPKTGQNLAQHNLIANHALRSLISQWCEDNNIPWQNERTSRIGKKGAGIEKVTCTGAGVEAMKLTAIFLVQKLTTGNAQVQKQVAYELRVLTKSSAENRTYVAEAGAIPYLVPMVSSTDAQTQEHAVTTLLNLSIVDDNRKAIVAAGALDPIIEVLTSGMTMEARENAAAALYSLSVRDEVKVQVGEKLNAIPSLITLLREGMERGKKDAATALFNLAVYHGNKPLIIKAGAVPELVSHLGNESSRISDTCLAVLSLLVIFPEGVAAICDTDALPSLFSLLRYGSPKGRENATSVLLAMCKAGNKAILDKVFQQIGTIVPFLYHLLITGSLRGRRKAIALFKLLHSFEPAVIDSITRTRAY